MNSLTLLSVAKEDVGKKKTMDGGNRANRSYKKRCGGGGVGAQLWVGLSSVSRWAALSALWDSVEVFPFSLIISRSFIFR